MSIRNSKCDCGSGKKYKKCCLRKNQVNPMADELAEGQMKFLATKPKCFVCKAEQISELGMIPTDKIGSAIHFALCEKCVADSDINNKILDTLKKNLETVTAKPSEGD